MPREIDYLFAFGRVVPDGYILIIYLNPVVGEPSSFLIVPKRIFVPHRDFAQSMYVFLEFLCALMFNSNASATSFSDSPPCSDALAPRALSSVSPLSDGSVYESF